MSAHKHAIVFHDSTEISFILAMFVICEYKQWLACTSYNMYAFLSSHLSLQYIVLFIICRGHLSRCVTPLVFMPAYCLRCWNDCVLRCSLKVLLFSFNVNLNTEEKTLYMQYYHNCTISLVHTVPDFSPGVATVWTPRPTDKDRIESG